MDSHLRAFIFSIYFGGNFKNLINQQDFIKTTFQLYGASDKSSQILQSVLDFFAQSLKDCSEAIFSIRLLCFLSALGTHRISAKVKFGKK